MACSYRFPLRGYIPFATTRKGMRTLLFTTARANQRLFLDARLCRVLSAKTLLVKLNLIPLVLRAIVFITPSIPSNVSTAPFTEDILNCFQVRVETQAAFSKELSTFRAWKL